MSRRKVLGLSILILVAAAGAAFAQPAEAPKSAEPAKFYKLDFVVKEVEGGRVLNSRSYSMTVAADTRDTASIRAGSKVPVATGSGAFQYIDVGVNIDCREIRDLQRGLSVSVSADISSVPSEPAGTPPTGATAPMPIVRQNRWGSTVLVPLRKPTLIFSSDDVASKRQMQLELTATPIT